MKPSFTYNPKSTTPHKLSRSKIDLFLECPRCFYLNQIHGIKRPSGPPFLLNTAVDHLLKQEFDFYRIKGTPHPLMKKYNVDAIPIPHQDLDQWRHNFTGVQYLHQPTNLLIYGAIDDLWQNSQKEYIVVDYKATSKKEPATSAQQLWPGFLTQMEIYQWLLRQKGYSVSHTGYFVHCNARKDKQAFDAQLEFNITLIPYQGNDGWVKDTINKIHNCLNQIQIPDPNPECDYCQYRNKATKATSTK